MDFVYPVTFALLFLLIVFATVIGVSRALRRRMTEGSRLHRRWASLAAATTAVCVFLITYWSAWVALRPYVALGQYGPNGPGGVRSDACKLDSLLDEYAKKHGHYPDSLKEAFPEDMDLRSTSYFDRWKNPYQYVRTDSGFRLFSLGRDGKPGGVGLDADFDLVNSPDLDLPITPSQFLFEGEGSGTLFRVAISASLCAGLACFIAAGSPRKDATVSWQGILFSVIVTAVLSWFVVGVLLAIYLIGSTH
jgi:hypothetical protein